MSVRSLQTKASYYPLKKRHTTEERKHQLHRFKSLKFNTKVYSRQLHIQWHVVGPCHHGMARPQIAVRGTAFNMEDSCE